MLANYATGLASGDGGQSSKAIADLTAYAGTFGTALSSLSPGAAGRRRHRAHPDARRLPQSGRRRPERQQRAGDLHRPAGGGRPHGRDRRAAHRGDREAVLRPVPRGHLISTVDPDAARARVRAFLAENLTADGRTPPDWFSRLARPGWSSPTGPSRGGSAPGRPSSWPSTRNSTPPASTGPTTPSPWAGPGPPSWWPAPRTSSGGSSPGCSTGRSSGASCSPNRRRAATCPR